ncbi:hypothetical protein ABZ532_20370 [Streptomyces sp. NPDC019396]|uniref:hypothetical protein n=1 Tax=Streptomyces sp. NPDC019396 TaxID=3154687 RepID=UPI0033CB9BCB
MAMVGLFWITPYGLYVGSPPAAGGGCVRLTTQGVEAVEPGRSRMWAWDGLRSAVVADVPTGEPSGRAAKLIGSVVSATAGAFLGGGPPAMTLRLETEHGPEELSVHSAAAGGYGVEEVSLSQDLLACFVAGTADPRAAEAWGREHGPKGTPKPSERAALLRSWARP